MAPERSGKSLGPLLEAAAELAHSDGGPVDVNVIRSILRETLRGGDFARAHVLALLLETRDVPVADRLMQAIELQLQPNPVETESAEGPQPWDEWLLQSLIEGK
jgi:hypothetical protein